MAISLSKWRQLVHVLNFHPLDLTSPKAPNEAAMQEIVNLGAIYRKLDRADQATAMRRTPAELCELVGIGAMVVEKNEAIAAGWGHPVEYYVRILDSLRASTPADGADHCFTVTIIADRAALTPIAEIPDDRGASTSKAVAKIVDGKLTAGYVFSDMGHAGVWGILFSDSELPLHTSTYNGGPEYWMFSDVGDRLFPHVYKAWNNLD